MKANQIEESLKKQLSTSIDLKSDQTQIFETKEKKETPSKIQAEKKFTFYVKNDKNDSISSINSKASNKEEIQDKRIKLKNLNSHKIKLQNNEYNFIN